jgi:3-oxoacyl-[acyl-carrier-protein] synthase-3
MRAVITGTGMAVPDTVVTNDDLSRIMDTDDHWISSRTGVHERRLVDPGVGSSDLAVIAGRAAIEDAGILANQVDALVTATMTPDFVAPGIGALVQHGLGLGQIPAFDLRQQCSGFLYGLDLADALISSSRANTVLVVGAEVHAGFFPWGPRNPDGSLISANAAQREINNRHRSWSVLFGDGAGAMIVRRGTGPSSGVLASQLFTDGAQFDLIAVPGLGFRNQPYADHDQIDQGLHWPVMDGGGLYRQAIRLMPEAVRAVCKQAGVEVDDIDIVVAHQANERILEGVRRQLGLAPEKVPSNIASYGNTTSATLPILYHELRAAGTVRSGHLVCFTAFGAGSHWGALLYREPCL